MNESEWLHDVLNNIREDIIEIKQDVKDLREAKHKLLGGIFVVSTIITVVINVVAIWARR